MKKYLLAFALTLPLLGGCANTPLVNGQSVAQTVPGATQEAEKALTVAHLAYNTIGQQLISATQSGILHGNPAALAKTYYDEAGDSLTAADTADAAANTTGLLDAISKAQTAIAQVQGVLKGGVQ